MAQSRIVIGHDRGFHPSMARSRGKTLNASSNSMAKLILKYSKRLRVVRYRTGCSFSTITLVRPSSLTSPSHKSAMPSTETATGSNLRKQPARLPSRWTQ